MEWTDTLMLESNRDGITSEVQGPSKQAGVDVVKAVSARVIAVQGTSIIQANGRTNDELTAALELLRGFRATGRRVVLCDTSQLNPGRQLGRSLVSEGRAEVVVSCGLHGRELAIGARDAGLDLASVVVCQDVKAACEVLVYRLGHGDTVLLWGVQQEVCNRLVALLERQMSDRTAAAA